MCRTLSAAMLFLLLPAGLVAAEKEYHVIKKIPVAGDGGWDYLTYDAAGQRLFISRATRVQVLDLASEKVTEIPNTPGVHGIALAPEHKRGFISNGGDSTVTVFDLESLKETARIPVGKRPDAIIYDDGSGRAFTFNAGSQDATAIDAAEGKVAGTVKLGGKPEFAAADGKGHVYVNIENKNEIVAIDSRELKVTERWKIAPGEEPAGLAMDREHRRLFSTCHNRKMVVLDADSGHVVKDLPIGRGTDAAAFNPTTGEAFSSNGDGTLTVVQEEGPDKFSVKQNVPTQAGARTMAVDAKGQRIFLVTAKRKAAQSGGGRRPSFEPGSFVVLVVGKD